MILKIKKVSTKKEQPRITEINCDPFDQKFTSKDNIRRHMKRKPITYCTSPISKNILLLSTLPSTIDFSIVELRHRFSRCTNTISVERLMPTNPHVKVCFKHNIFKTGNYNTL